MKSILEEARDNGALDNKLLEILVNKKAHEKKPRRLTKAASHFKEYSLSRGKIVAGTGRGRTHSTQDD